jgi:hypothetical protein
MQSLYVQLTENGTFKQLIYFQEDWTVWLVSDYK